MNVWNWNYWRESWNSGRSETLYFGFCSESFPSRASGSIVAFGFLALIPRAFFFSPPKSTPRIPNNTSDLYEVEIAVVLSKRARCTCPPSDDKGRRRNCINVHGRPYGFPAEFFRKRARKTIELITFFTRVYTYKRDVFKKIPQLYPR